ncbi:MAG: ABC transporter ATP-binding protein [Thermincola sp.]|jgi:ABC-type dipeptide/oligopeptide/nickel transport system ATPase component|nr:ABC transporter ATP-binding protein [Thermincola sp.]MDT3702800.1 ABC transporter ATP-binding protein [Thermincola sp.]
MQILRVKNLKTYFNSPHGLVKAVDNVNFELVRGETLGIIGESGAGKSVTALSIMGLSREIGAVHYSGEVWFDGANLFETPNLYKHIRGKRIGFIPQEAGNALNPVLTVGCQLSEMISVHLGWDRQKSRQRAAELLEMVELEDYARVLSLCPFQLSGGMLQRVLLAMTLSCEPDLIIADEPASALDVIIQSQILNLIKNITKDRGMAMVLIAHDLGVISRYSDRVMVMRNGRTIETGATNQVLKSPAEPYTKSLLENYCSGQWVAPCRTRGNFS